VHPNVEGYFHLATSFYGPLVAALGDGEPVDDATARRELPVTVVDRLSGEYRVTMLKSDWPFVPERRPVTFPAPANRVEEIAQRWFAGQLSWTEAMNEALAWYQQQGNYAEAARVAVNLADGLVTSAETQYVAGALLLRADSAARGLLYLRRAIALDAGKVEYPLSLAQAQFMLGRPQDSIATLEGILQQHPGEPRAEYWLAEIRRQAPGR
jgi:tetratricopeptide (TPR) repeat protein